MNVKLDKEKINAVVAALQTVYQLDCLLLFGSHAKGTAHPESDLDLAVLAQNTLAPYERYLIAQEIAVLMDCDVDLVEFRLASEVLKVQLIANHRVLFEKDPLPRQLAFMQALKAYAMLNDERKTILANRKRSYREVNP